MTSKIPLCSKIPKVYHATSLSSCLFAFLIGENRNDCLQAIFYCLGTLICSDPSNLQLALRGKPKGSCRLWACREYSLASHLVTEWEAAGSISKCKLAFHYTKSPSVTTSLARLILIYLTIFPFCWLLVSQSLLRIIKNEPLTLDFQFCFFLYLIQSLGDIVIC